MAKELFKVDLSYLILNRFTNNFIRLIDVSEQLGLAMVNQ